MKTKDVIEYFGGVNATARVLDIAHPAVCQWGEYPPYGRQAEIELITQGALKREPKQPALQKRPCHQLHVSKVS
ncbi:Cro/CI family transcriptional regulator [Bowmanella denitrificans]|uniref:Cro/CI family transcriptional regulator n=1 Tax=Bowmanella denitrificans TaxID=366582 RepID=UPI000C9A6772